MTIYNKIVMESRTNVILYKGTGGHEHCIANMTPVYEALSDVDLTKCFGIIVTRDEVIVHMREDEEDSTKVRLSMDADAFFQTVLKLCEGNVF